MSSNRKLMVMPGDGIGPEVMNETFKKEVVTQDNDLKEFGVDNDSPDLFSSENETSSAENLLSQENEDQEDDLEIPAFLRRQKN